MPEADGVLTAARKHMAFMPLELFDNSEYEAREPLEWLALGKDAGVSYTCAITLARSHFFARLAAGQRRPVQPPAPATALLCPPFQLSLAPCWMLTSSLSLHAQGTPAETLMYQVKGDAYTWVPCRVVRWDEGARAYEVVFAPKKVRHAG